MTRENNNPWAGLASYEDPAKSERKLKFCGRDNDIFDVAQLIDDNLLLILYGKSGIGKTSLLNAGVFPKLRQEQYLPVSIRLGTLEADASYQEAVVEAIERAIEEVRGGITVFNVVEEQNDDQQPERLWNYFTRHRFANAEGLPLFPVVVLDQFEEVLRNANAEHVKKAQTLLNQIQYLIDESHALNDCVVDGKEYYYDFNFRFVISIREDELYLLEDNIDDLSLNMFRNCRYRLRPMTPEQARQVVLVPGKDCFDENEKESISNQIISLVERNSNNSIDTLLLSLICSEMYNIAFQHHSNITKALIEQLGSNVLYSFYENCILSVSSETVDYIESHLLTQSGFRNSIALEDILHDEIKKEDLDKLIENQLLRIESSKGIKRLEFSHDALCYIAKDSRDKHIAEDKSKKNFSHNIGFLFDISVPLVALCSLAFNKDWQDWQLADLILLLVVLFAACIVFPYRHSRDRNSIWFSLLSYLCWFEVTKYLFFDPPVFFVTREDEVVLYTIFFGGILYNIHFFYSFSFKKKRSFKEAVKYIFKLQVYKEYPKFKIILLIVVSILLLIYFCSPLLV